jgi:hypothetical protein
MKQKKMQEAKKEAYGKIIIQYHHGSGEEKTGAIMIFMVFILFIFFIIMRNSGGKGENYVI